MRKDILNYLQHIWKDLEGIMLSEISQREITYMRSEKVKWMETYQNGGYEGLGSGGKGEMLIGECKLQAVN